MDQILKKLILKFLSLAIAALNNFSKDKFRLEIGDIGLFRELVSQLNVSDEVAEDIRRLIETKNYPALNELLDSLGKNDIIDALKQLPRLFGGIEVFEKAAKLYSNLKVNAILENLKKIYTVLKQLGFDNQITVDLGIVNRTNYYTGLVFKGYIKGYGDAILSGGRYDKLLNEFGYDVPAIGFGINVDAIASNAQKNEVYSKNIDAVIFSEEDYEYASMQLYNELSQKGLIVENSLFDSVDETKKYASSKGIKKIYVVSEKIEIIDL